MRYTFAVLALFLCAVSDLMAEDAEVRAKLDALKAVVLSDDAYSKSESTKEYALRSCATLTALLEKEEYLPMQDLLRETSSYIKGQNALSAISALTTAVRAAAAKQIAEILKADETLLADLGKRLRSAKTAEEVDPILQSLQQAQVKAKSVRLQNYGNDFEIAIRVAADWQDYLRYQSSGKTKLAIERLQRIQTDVIRLPIMIPRSDVIKRIDEIEPTEASERRTQAEVTREVQALIEQTNGIDAIPALYEKVDLIAPPGDGGNPYFVTQVRRLKQAYDGWKLHDIDTALSALMPQQNESASVLRLKRALLLEVVPLYLEQPETVKKETDTPASLTDRMIEEAVKQRNWSAVYRGLHAYRVFGGNSSGQTSRPELNDDISAVSNLISAYNFEQAEQWTEATKYYLNALRSAKKIAIGPFVSERLKGIKEKQPEAYKAATAPEFDRSRPSFNQMGAARPPEFTPHPSLPPAPPKQSTPPAAAQKHE